MYRHLKFLSSQLSGQMSGILILACLGCGGTLMMVMLRLPYSLKSGNFRVKLVNNLLVFCPLIFKWTYNIILVYFRCGMQSMIKLCHVILEERWYTLSIAPVKITSSTEAAHLSVLDKGVKRSSWDLGISSALLYLLKLLTIFVIFILTWIVSFLGGYIVALKRNLVQLVGLGKRHDEHCNQHGFALRTEVTFTFCQTTLDKSDVFRLDSSIEAVGTFLFGNLRDIYFIRPMSPTGLPNLAEIIEKRKFLLAWCFRRLVTETANMWINDWRVFGLSGRDLYLKKFYLLVVCQVKYSIVTGIGLRSTCGIKRKHACLMPPPPQPFPSFHDMSWQRTLLQGLPLFS